MDVSVNLLGKAMNRNSRSLRIESLESRLAMDVAAAESMSVLAEGEGPPKADFQLEDVNPASARFGEMVSPRDYLSQVSAWYFAHST
jgi:hypothetical protein